MSQIKLKSPTEVLKARMKKHRNELKPYGITFSKWCSKICEFLPEMNAAEYAGHLHNVWYGRVADVELTEQTAKILEVLESK